MTDSDKTQKSNGEFMFILESKEKGNRSLSPELQENYINKSNIRKKNISPEK